MNSKNPTYTEVLEMIRQDNAEIKKVIRDIDRKLDTVDNRLTVVETQQASNKNWGLWLYGFVVTAVNLLLNYFI